MNFLTDCIGRDVEIDRSDRIELLQKSLIDVFVPGMVYREMDSLLLYFTSGHTILSTYELPDDGPGSLAQVLGHFPEEPPSPAESVASDEGGGYNVPDEHVLALIGFNEVCAGIAVTSAALEALDITLLGWIERDHFMMRYLRLAFPFALWCRGIMGGAWRSWSWAGRVPLILVGGPPCVFATLLGRQRGLADNRSDPLTVGVPSIASRFGTLFALIEMVVPAAILNNGEAIDKLDSAMSQQAGLLRAPTADAHPKGVEIVDTVVHGGLAARPRLMLYYEHPYVSTIIGSCPPVVPGHHLPRWLSDVFEPPGKVPSYCIPKGVFHPLPGTKPKLHAPRVAGYFDFGQYPLRPGCLVTIILWFSADGEEKGLWRILECDGKQLLLLKADCQDDPIRRTVHARTVSRLLPQRLQGWHPQGVASTIARRGEPPQLSAHQLVLRPSLGPSAVTTFTAFGDVASARSGRREVQEVSEGQPAGRLYRARQCRRRTWHHASDEKPRNWGRFHHAITLLLNLSGRTLPARVSEWHHREPRVGGTMLAPNFARIDTERLENEICSIRRGPLGRAATLEIAARHGSRCVLSSRLVIYAHGDSRTRSISLATTLEPARPCPSTWTKPSQPNLAILTAGRAPARTRARDLVSNRTVWWLLPPQPSRRAARLGVRIVLFSSVVRPSLHSAR